MTETKPKKVAKIRHCCYCGAELGCYFDYDPFDTCGKSECERYVRDQLAEEPRVAHENLDRDMGWSY